MTEKWSRAVLRGLGSRKAPRLPDHIRQEQGNRIRTIIAPSQEAIKRHLAAIDQRLLQLQTAPQARVIEELNPLVIGWVAYYNGVVPTSAMGRFDALIEQRLLNWA